MDRATGAGGGIVKERALALELGRQIFPELTAIASRGGARIWLPTFSIKPAEV